MPRMAATCTRLRTISPAVGDEMSIATAATSLSDSPVAAEAFNANEATHSNAAAAIAAGCAKLRWKVNGTVHGS